jgi:hypothetical protein
MEEQKIDLDLYNGFGKTFKKNEFQPMIRAVLDQGFPIIELPSEIIQAPINHSEVS